MINALTLQVKFSDKNKLLMPQYNLKFSDVLDHRIYVSEKVLDKILVIGKTQSTWRILTKRKFLLTTYGLYTHPIIHLKLEKNVSVVSVHVHQQNCTKELIGCQSSSHNPRCRLSLR